MAYLISNSDATTLSCNAVLRKKQQRDGTPLTLVEMRSAKQKKETMLKNSFAAAAATLAEDLSAAGSMLGS